MGNFLLFPQDGKVRVTSPFGMRNGSMHRGVDVASDNVGTDWNLAAADAIVTRVSFEASGAGHWLEARALHKHLNKDIYFRYFHLKEPPRFYDRPGKPAIKVGNQLKQGEKVGIEGNTGHSAGSHLHFEVRIGGTATSNAVDPVPHLWVPKALPINDDAVTKAQFRNVKYVEDFVDEGSETMKRGDKGEPVGAMQEGLMFVGYSMGKYGADKDFGGVTESAVKMYQQNNGLQATGIMDPITYAALTRSIIAQSKAISARLDKAKAAGTAIANI